MHQYIYMSKAKEGLRKDDVARILNASRKNNKKQKITGVLVYDRGMFIQVLEGKRKKLDHLLNVISKDARNDNLITLSSVPLEHRMFDKWNMAYLEHMSDELFSEIENKNVVPLKSLEHKLDSNDLWVTDFLRQAIQSI